MTSASNIPMEIYTPVTLLWDRVLMLPIVGVVDSQRAQSIMDAMLARISETEARVVILDIEGVETVDTAVANHLIKITQATQLMGARCIVSGISPAIAQTLVQLGIPLTDIVTRATLRDAVYYALQTLGLDIRQSANAPLR